MEAATPTDYLTSMEARLRSAVDSLGLWGQPVALVGFPNHPNSGDSAIWLGERLLLDTIGARLVETRGSVADRAPAVVRRGRILLFHGGGNLGDLWPEEQRWREVWIERNPGARAIVFPQSVDFRDASALERACSVMRAHPALTVLVRDERSAERAQALTSDVRLVPDAAFALGPLTRPVAATTDVVWILRTDHESHLPTERIGIPATDWVQFPEFTRGSRSWRRAVAYDRLPPWPLVDRVRAGFADGLARTRVDRASRMLAAGDRVVTDRLHGHVLCSLMGIPHVVVASTNSKVTAFLRTWPGDPTVVGVCSTVEEAAEILGVETSGG